jgi:hypothetical protein
MKRIVETAKASMQTERKRQDLEAPAAEQSEKRSMAKHVRATRITKERIEKGESSVSDYRESSERTETEYSSTRE